MAQTEKCMLQCASPLLIQLRYANYLLSFLPCHNHECLPFFFLFSLIFPCWADATASLWSVWVLYIQAMSLPIHLPAPSIMAFWRWEWKTKFWPLGLEVKPYGMSSHWIGVLLHTKCLANPSETQQPLALFLGLVPIKSLVSTVRGAEEGESPCWWTLRLR